MAKVRVINNDLQEDKYPLWRKVGDILIILLSIPAAAYLIGWLVKILVTP